MLSMWTTGPYCVMQLLVVEVARLLDASRSWNQPRTRGASLRRGCTSIAVSRWWARLTVC